MRDCLVVAVATPITERHRPDVALLIERCRRLMADGCDGVTLFGTTGEGAEFCIADRTAALEQVIAAGIPADRIIVSVGALSIPDVVALARHAIDQKVNGVLLMPPCLYRGGITDDGAFRFYASVIDAIARPDLRLYLYHFPDICGVPVTPNVVRRLDERYPGQIAGIKDSGGDLDFTEALLRRFSHLSIFTGSETHVPQVLASGGRGTICGLANVMPRLMRAMLDAPNLFERRRHIQQILSADMVLSRRPFIASIKAITADSTGVPAWRRVLPPMSEPPLLEEQRMIADFRRWEATLPAGWRSLYPAEPEAGAEADPRVVPLRRN
ncbi:MAG: dihydrodipicolinate synthase family protein [Alphaproteobacteria bacterium]|nr:dihydrodipicolinate synthase family protein [Alphaproteobacteria bacterium]